MNVALLGHDFDAAETAHAALTDAGHNIERWDNHGYAVEPCDADEDAGAVPNDGNADPDAPLDAFVAVIDDAPPGGFLEGGEEVFYSALECSFYATMRACRSALMRLNEGSAMIFIVTARARLGEAGYTAASAAAGGVYMQARSYAITAAPLGVRSNGIVLYDGWDAQALKNAVNYLLSPASAYMSGGYITLGAPSVVCAQPVLAR